VTADACPGPCCPGPRTHQPAPLAPHTAEADRQRGYGEFIWKIFTCKHLKLKCFKNKEIIILFIEADYFFKVVLRSCL